MPRLSRIPSGLLLRPNDVAGENGRQQPLPRARPNRPRANTIAGGYLGVNEPAPAVIPARGARRSAVRKSRWETGCGSNRSSPRRYSTTRGASASGVLRPVRRHRFSGCNRRSCQTLGGQPSIPADYWCLPRGIVRSRQVVLDVRQPASRTLFQSYAAAEPRLNRR